ncbi:MAG: 8-amino-7-oxononanoate synthase (EC [uncultured Sulfurovum sp.]|uniref:8-amino-7-oxononanoate synthase (EC) n=1 Tax=uncultured Sulfurovum sp. TaxID=269237 RepID=A0A6S6T6C3_9BACT|nr:MAG: 8-amino-7-oxononanoate synthase (EC [uncultured Sulfurovum sp.]
MIYSTAPSIIDTALALVNIEYVSENSEALEKEINIRQKAVEKIMKIPIQALILPIPMLNNKSTLLYQKRLEEAGYLIGAIRQPTVKEPILRVIPRLGTSLNSFKSMLYEIKL